MRAGGTPSLRQRSITTAREILLHNPVYLDTETTGLGPQDEIIEVTVIDHDGTPLIDTLVKPGKPIPPDATAIHGIRNSDVSSAPAWVQIWDSLRSALFSRLIVIYNADFDLRMLRQTHTLAGLHWKERLSAFDMMRLYGEFRGEWDPRRRGYRFHSLAAAGRQCRIPLPNAHRSRADVLLTRELLIHVARQEE